MKFFIKLIFILTSLTILSAEEKFLLIDGTVIQGEITSESDLSITVQTNYGEITISNEGEEGSSPKEGGSDKKKKSSYHCRSYRFSK